MNVSACLVTRGDVDMQPIIDSLPNTWEVVIWDNSGTIQRSDGWAEVCTNLQVYGRYAAIEYASHDLIYVQDDDVIVSDPQAIVDALVEKYTRDLLRRGGLSLHSEPELRPAVANFVVCNMPQEFRPHYPDSGLVGFGAAFHRDAPTRAFTRWIQTEMRRGFYPLHEVDPVFQRRADNVFTVLTPRVLVDVPKTDCIYASDPNRMWRQSDHIGERDRMIELARLVRDA